IDPTACSSTGGTCVVTVTMDCERPKIPAKPPQKSCRRPGDYGQAGSLSTAAMAVDTMNRTMMQMDELGGEPALPVLLPGIDPAPPQELIPASPQTGTNPTQEVFPGRPKPNLKPNGSPKPTP
ncbi:MAG: hypothetical protein KGQ59_12450, partial [Bdellovibrionales bacterium]|nr:hypothetical protein [Bdellovibrionales bacterium]